MIKILIESIFAFCKELQACKLGKLRATPTKFNIINYNKVELLSLNKDVGYFIGFNCIREISLHLKNSMKERV